MLDDKLAATFVQTNILKLAVFLEPGALVVFVLLPKVAHLCSMPPATTPQQWDTMTRHEFAQYVLEEKGSYFPR